MCNFKYRYYAQIDYKSCFDSIYSHAYKWIIERNVIDSKAAKNSHLFITIDRILQNINGQSSNGLIVGPEFSRMIAEVLLQQIDNEVSANLSKSSIVHNRDYAAFRYVDDIFLFANEESALGQIIDQYRVVGENYLIQLNDQKIHCDKTPCLPKEWLKETRDIATSIGGIFFQGKRAEYEELPIERRFIVKEDFVFVDRIKDEISILVKRFSEDRRTIVSFLLSTFLNNIEKKSKNYVLFGGRSVKKALLIIDLILYTYAFYPSFEQTRKVISMISYINSEINFKSDADAKRKLSNIIERYSFVFHQGNLFDLCDWFPLLLEYEISLNATTENYIKKTVKGHNDPILWANLLLYSSYYPSFQNEISGEVEAVLERALLHLSETQAFLQNEFWFILVFHNCPFISRALIAKMEAVICKLQPIQSANTSANPPTTSETATQLVCSFLQLKSANGIKPKQSFFNWGGTRGFGGQITFRTYQRTLFKKYRRKSHGLYVSLS